MQSSRSCQYCGMQDLSMPAETCVTMTRMRKPDSSCNIWGWVQRFKLVDAVRLIVHERSEVERNGHLAVIA